VLGGRYAGGRPDAVLSVARTAYRCADQIPRGVPGEVLDERLADRLRTTTQTAWATHHCASLEQINHEAGPTDSGTRTLPLAGPADKQGGDNLVGGAR
jgi:hypothetical protein